MLTLPLRTNGGRSTLVLAVAVSNRRRLADDHWSYYAPGDRMTTAPRRRGDAIMTNRIDELKRRMQQLADPATAETLSRFFKTGPGGYGEGDRFLGLRMPTLRKLAREYHPLPLDQITELLHSAYHEQRMLALLLLVRAYEDGDERQRDHIYRLYLAETAFINNWDLVDASAEHIVGAHLARRDRRPLKALARSDSLWDRRIAIIATFHFIKRGELDPTLEIATMLRNDPHDLIHKAVGWMLREVGKRDEDVLRTFLDEHHARMPRTTLRYAIERLPIPLREQLLKR